MNGEIYLEELVATLKEAGDRTVLEHDGVRRRRRTCSPRSTATPARSTASGSAAATWSPSTRRTAPRRWPSVTPRTSSGRPRCTCRRRRTAQQRAAHRGFRAGWSSCSPRPPTCSRRRHRARRRGRARCPASGCGSTGALPPSPAAPLPSRARPDDLAVVISSGGTTGVPKGSMRTFAGYTIAVAAPADRHGGSWPTASWPTSPRSSSTRPCSAAARSSCRTSSSPPPRSPRSNRTGSPTCSWSSRSCSQLMDHPDVATRDLTSLRTLHIGASAPAALRRRARGPARPGGRAHLRRQRDGDRQRAVARRARPARSGSPARAESVPGVEVRFRRGRRRARPGRGRLIEVRSPRWPGLPPPARRGGRGLRRRLVPHRRRRAPRPRRLPAHPRPRRRLATAPPRRRPVVTPTACRTPCAACPASATRSSFPTAHRTWVGRGRHHATPVAPTVRTAAALAHRRGRRPTCCSWCPSRRGPADRAGQAGPHRHPPCSASSRRREASGWRAGRPRRRARTARAGRSRPVDVPAVGVDAQIAVGRGPDSSRSASTTPIQGAVQ